PWTVQSCLDVAKITLFALKEKLVSDLAMLVTMSDALAANVFRCRVGAALDALAPEAAVAAEAVADVDTMAVTATTIATKTSLVLIGSPFGCLLFLAGVEVDGA